MNSTRPTAKELFARANEVLDAEGTRAERLARLLDHRLPYSPDDGYTGRPYNKIRWNPSLKTWELSSGGRAWCPAFFAALKGWGKGKAVNVWQHYFLNMFGNSVPEGGELSYGESKAEPVNALARSVFTLWRQARNR